MDDRQFDLIKTYLTHNEVSVADLPKAIEHLKNAFEGNEPKPVPAVPIEQSITDEYIYCLEDGKPLKVLKKYLKNNFDMSVEEYRQKWGLPDDYPVVAKNYSEQRSKIAKQNGLGKS